VIEFASSSGNLSCPILPLGGGAQAPKLTLLAIFNYILRLLYLGCQWKELPIEKIKKAIQNSLLAHL